MLDRLPMHSHKTLDSVIVYITIVLIQSNYNILFFCLKITADLTGIKFDLKSGKDQ